MKAAVVTETGVQIRDVAAPAPKPSEVLVRVRASGLNRADLAVAAGRSHGSVGGPGTVVGMEFAGEVAQIGGDVKGVKAGDRVIVEGVQKVRPGMQVKPVLKPATAAPAEPAAPASPPAAKPKAGQ